MSVEMAIWRMTDDGPTRLSFTSLEVERRLEDMIVNDPTMAVLEILVIGRQVSTAYGGFVDVLGVDDQGQVHVVELKRDRTPREVVAQVLDYGSWAVDLTLDDVARMWAERHEGAFGDAFSERFSIPVPDVFNPDQRLTIVASGLDPSSDRIVTYLAERFGVPLNTVFFRHFIDEGREYLARTWLLPPQAVEAATQRRAGASGRTYLYKGRRPRISDLLETGLLEPGERLVFLRPKLGEAFVIG